MTEEYIYERERDILDYFRNNLTDPSSRGTNVTETFTATAGQTNFTLTNTLVKNVAETITVNGITKRKGYDYTVSYGEGNSTTTVVLRVGANVGEAVVISYHYGESMVEREYSRTDVLLPRVVMMFLTGTEQEAGLGDAMETGTGTYFVASYVFEIRDKYASRARQLMSQAFNLCMKLRHAGLFRIIITKASDAKNFDFDREKDAYIWQFTLDIKWDLLFQ